MLRRPRAGDADAIFARYSSDPDVTRFVGWPMHRSVDETRAFLDYSDAEWTRWLGGPYLIVSRADGRCSAAPASRSRRRLARHDRIRARERRLGTRAMRPRRSRRWSSVARDSGVRRLYALCHHEHRASAHVLEKCDFAREGVLRGYAEFPNLIPVEPQDVACYAILL